MEMLLTLLPPASSAVALTDCGYRRVACWNSSSSADCDSRTLLFALRNSGISSRSLGASRKPFVRWQRVGRGGAVKKIAASLTTGEADPSVTVEEEAEELRSTPKSKVDVSQHLAVLKTAAKTRKVPPTELLVAINAIDNAKVDPSDFLQRIGGTTESPGRTWMLIFTADKKLVKDARDGGPGGGFYLPVTAVQGFDAVAMRNTNGIFLGPIGSLEFEGRFSWKNRILAFLFEKLIIKVGPLGPFTINIEKKEDAGRTPGNADPLFVWFYADDEILVAKGRSGGVAFWCRCARVPQ